MAAQEDIGEFVKNSITSVKEILGKLNEIEKNLNKISLNEESDKNKLLKQTKQLIDDVFESSCKTKNIFYDKYDKIVKPKINKKKEKIAQTSSSEYEDANSTRNSEETLPIVDDEETFPLVDDEETLSLVNSEEILPLVTDKDLDFTNSSDDIINSTSDSLIELENENKKSCKTNISSTMCKKNKDVNQISKNLNSKQLNEEKSSDEETSGSNDKRKMNRSKSNKKVNKTADEEIQINKENESSESDSDQENLNESKTKQKVVTENVESELVQKEADKDKKNESSKELDKSAIDKESVGQEIIKNKNQSNGKTDAILIDPESENPENGTSVTEDSNKEKGNIDTLESDEDKDEEPVVNGDIEMSLAENELNNKETKETSDSIVILNKQVTEEPHIEDNSEEVNSTENDETSKQSSIKQENIEHNKENIETMPKIRLVSLDKLMEKPKKSVSFDTSIIILSSDDESSPQKSTETVEQSHLEKPVPKKIEEDLKEKVSTTKSACNDDTNSLSRKSSRISNKEEDKQKERSRLKSIFKRTKSNEWKGEAAYELDSDNKKSNKKKQSVVGISDSSDDDYNRNKINKSSKKRLNKSKKLEKNNLYVPLPIIDCEKLQEICSKDKNIFSVESILSRISKRGSKRLRKRDSENSSESDRGGTKRKKEDTSKQKGSQINQKLKSSTTVDEEEADDDDKNETSSHSERKNKKEDTTNGSEDESTATKEQQKSKEKNDDNSSSENEASSKKTSETVPICSSDSEDDFASKKKKKTKSEKKKKKKVISDSEEDFKNDEAGCSSDDNSKSSDNNSKCSDKESGSDSDSKDKKKSTKRRIKRAKDSSSESEEDVSTRKQIRRLIDRDSLSETTKKAEAEEKERKSRILEKQKKYNAILGEAKDASVETVVLEIDDKTEKEILCVDPKLAKKLKPHQASGIRFMWDACFESLERAKDTAGSGCILAHCMGLGKTLQVIALAHTLLQNSKLTGVNKVLVVCPVNTVLNWKSEFKKWLPKKTDFDIYELVSCKQMSERSYRVNEWHEDGGVLIIGYTMFRNISNPDNKKIQKRIRETFVKGLVDPGADLVICDEGHLLKNEKTNLSIAMNRIKTSRRIVLTGTPLQNNLKEYWCMVQFIKPNLLGTYKEYLNRFVNPIINGQYTDSTQHDIVLMRKRSHVLHKLLDGVVQRRDYSVLEPYLPPKHEYVIFVRLSDVQVKLCQHYMDNYAQRKNGNSKVSFIFTDFQQLQRICTHPRVLLDRSSERKEKFFDDEDSEGSLKDFIVDGDKTSSSSSSSASSNSGSDSDGSHKSGKNRKQQKTRVTRAQAAQRRENNEESDPEIVEVERKEWWQDFCDGDELDNINNSGKLSLLFHLLKECEEIGDKILIFSQSLYTLNCIEYFLEKIDEATTNGETEKFGGYSGTWHIGLDYFRLDGSSSCDNRATWCDMFNSPDNTRARLFLISTKAGGLGINLVAANRVIIFDVSWNPSHDIQSIYRVYRFGQTKPSYIYRFVTYGAMEMKIYERQVTKQAISKRVIDEQQIDRHYNQNDLQELYKSEFIPIEERPIPLVPKDVLLGEMLQKYDKIIYKYHEHQSLLENKEEECLNEEERKAAWDEFENEKVLRKTTYTGNLGIAGAGTGIVGINAPLIALALSNIVRRDNPTWSDIQVSGIIPALVQQLKVQLSENDTVMYSRVQQEIQRMQTEAREAEFQRQMRQMYAHSQYMQMARQQMNFATIRQMYDSIYPRPQLGASSSGNPQPASANDVIELND